ncbi:hypothetical protein [Candidatus Nitrosocosmicus franklandus]|nr:hypothetical protein [Candidatus Nitrosocosmicus franklandus]
MIEEKSLSKIMDGGIKCISQEKTTTGQLLAGNISKGGSNTVGN